MESQQSQQQEIARSPEVVSPTSVNIVSEENKTIEDLKAIAAKHPVLFTPHVGNKWREDLYLLQYGITTANFERNASALDDLDFPEKLRLNGAIYDISNEQQTKSATITPYLKFRDSLAPEAEEFVRRLEARKPGHLHHKSTLAAVGKGKLVTSAEALFMGPENRLLRDLITALHLHSLQNKTHDRVRTFTRFIDGQGRMLLGDKSTTDYHFDGSYHYGENGASKHFYDQEKVKQFPAQFFDMAKKLSDSINTGDSVEGVEGPVPRNEIMVLLLALKPLLSEVQDGQGNLDLDEKGRYHAYAVSGPSMIKYASAKDFRNTMTEQYATIRELAKRFDLDLPAQIVLHMIPGGSLSYLPVEGETQAIDAINKYCQVDTEYRAVQAKMSGVSKFSTCSSTLPRRADIIVASAAAKAKPTQEMKDLLFRFTCQMKDAVMGIVEASVASPHVSQYDLLAGQKLLPESQLEALEKISFKQHIIISNLLSETRQKLLTTKQ